MAFDIERGGFLEERDDDPPLGNVHTAADKTAATLLIIGVRIRDARIKRSLTLKDLAARAGLSPSMLSLIERGRASPSISSLIAISLAVGVAIADLVKDDHAVSNSIVVRADQALEIRSDGYVARRVMRDDRLRGIAIAEDTYQPSTKGAPRSVAHSGYEYGYVLEGNPTVELDGRAYGLRPGDLISYDSTRFHRISNDGVGIARTLWFNFIESWSSKN